MGKRVVTLKFFPHQHVDFIRYKIVFLKAIFSGMGLYDNEFEDPINNLVMDLMDIFIKLYGKGFGNIVWSENKNFKLLSSTVIVNAIKKWASLLISFKPSIDRLHTIDLLKLTQIFFICLKYWWRKPYLLTVVFNWVNIFLIVVNLF